MIFDGPQHVENFIRPQLTFSQEEIGVLAFNSQMELLSHTLLFRGTADQCLFHSRDLFRFLIIHNATRFILFHNHLSSNALPSIEDLVITKKICSLAALFEMDFVDHLILSKMDMISLKDLGYIQEFKKNHNFIRQYSKIGNLQKMF